MWNGKKISVVMPAYNEEKGIYDTVKGFKKLKEVDEVLVVDNNSKDDTAKLAKKAGARVVLEIKQGYGYACFRALKESKGDYVVLVESDNSFYPNDIYKFLAFINEFDMVKGGRSNKHMIEKNADWGFFLKYGNWFIAKLIQVLYGGPSMREAGGTYRIIKKQCLRKILPHIKRFDSAFLPEIVTIALKKNFKILEIPINYRKREGISKITGNKLKALLLGFNMIYVVFANRFRKF